MNSNLAEKLPVEEELQTTALTLKDQATAMMVVDVPTYQMAGELGKGIKELRAKIVDYFAPLKKAAHDSHKAITSREAEELRPVDEAINILRDTMNAFTREQERLRQEEERKARERAEAEAEKERQRLLALAVKAEEKGKDEKAAELLERAEEVYTAPVTVAPTVAKTVSTGSGNITQAKETKVTVTDMKAFIIELVKRNMAPTMIVEKQAILTGWVKVNGFENFPGLSIQKTTGVRF